MKSATKKEKSNCPFVRAAECLLRAYKSPADFLLFLNDALTWIHHHQVRQPEYSHGKDNHFSIQVVIEEIVVPWIGAQENALSVVAEGISRLHSFHGWDGQMETMSRLLEAFGYYENESHSYPQYMAKHLTGINVMYQIAYCFYDHEQGVGVQDQAKILKQEEVTETQAA